MVDMPSPYSPSSTGDSVLVSPLCGDLIQDMEELEDLSRSMEDDAFNTFLENKSSSTGSECSTALGKCTVSVHSLIHSCTVRRKRLQSLQPLIDLNLNATASHNLVCTT